jgi:hypothetical protein
VSLRGRLDRLEETLARRSVVVESRSPEVPDDPARTAAIVAVLVDVLGRDGAREVIAQRAREEGASDDELTEFLHVLGLARETSTE